MCRGCAGNHVSIKNLNIAQKMVSATHRSIISQEESVAGEWLYSSSPLDRARAAAEGEVEERTRRFRTVTVITPRAMKAAAPIAISAEMLRMIFL